jgi:glycosyltransferase involved in cell wall biosynthesis
LEAPILCKENDIKLNKIIPVDTCVLLDTNNINIKTPKVTIIVPMFNVELYIQNCVLSLVQQQYSNIQIILVNDKSTDNTKKIANELMYKYPDKIKVIHNLHNVGTYISINLGIINSTGEYITIIGADDQFTLDKVDKQVNVLKNKKIVACYCQYERRHYKSKNVLVKDVGESTIMFKRTILKKIGYYDSVRFGADSEYRDRIRTTYGPKAVNVISKVMYIALSRPNSLTTSGKSKSGSILRITYKNNYVNWHKKNKNLYLAFPLTTRPFSVPIELLV